MLWTVTRSPSMVAWGSTATSGCQSRLFDGVALPQTSRVSANATAKPPTAHQRAHRTVSAPTVMSPSATKTQARPVRTVSEAGVR